MDDSSPPSPSDARPSEQESNPLGLEEAVDMLPPKAEFPEEKDFHIARELIFRAYHAGDEIGDEFGLDRAAEPIDVLDWVHDNMGQSDEPAADEHPGASM